MAKNEWDELNQSVLNIAVKASLKKPRKPSVLSEIKKINTYEDWTKFCKKYELNMIVDLGHRGGVLGVYTSGFMKLLKHTKLEQLTTKMGAYCNYLGGGLRGSIQKSDYDRVENDKDYSLVEAFLDACVRAYEDAEKESGVPDDAMEGVGRVNVKSAY